MLKKTAKMSLLLLAAVLIQTVGAIAAAPYIVGSVNVSGAPYALQIVKGRPDLLVATVNPYGKPVRGEKYGLQIIDVRHPASPRVIGFLPMPGLGWTRLASPPSGRFVFLAYDRQMTVVDISDPFRPRSALRFGDRVSGWALAGGGKYLLVAEDYTNRNGWISSHIRIFDVTNPVKPNLVQTIDPPQHVYSAEFLSGDREILLSDFSTTAFVYDIEKISRPELRSKWDDRSDFAGRIFPQSVSDRFFVGTSNGFSIWSIDRNLTKIGDYQGGDGERLVVSPDGRRVYLPESGGPVLVVDVSDPALPRTVGRFPVSSRISALAYDNVSGLVFVGSDGRITAIDPSGHQLDKNALLAAQREALAISRKPAKGKDGVLEDLHRWKKAASPLEAAGIQDALREKPAGMTDRQYAALLNDYAYYRMQDRNGLDEVVAILRMCVRVDPDRASARLNLGEALQLLLPSIPDYSRKVEASREAGDNYRAWKKMTGKAHRKVDSFLAANLADHPPKSVCQYVADRANQGRLGEAIGVKERMDIDGDGREERIALRTEGTMRMDSLYLFDGDTGAAISYNGIDEDAGLGASGYEISIIPFGGRYYILHSVDSSYPTTLTRLDADHSEVSVCTFAVEVKEEDSGRGPDKKLCETRLSSAAPLFFPFSGGGNMPAEENGWKIPKGTLAFDFDNDGRKEKVVEIEYASTAGRGCSYTYFDLLDSNEGRISKGAQRSRLAALQDLSFDSFHPVPHCHGNSAGWFRHDGKVYFETRYPGDGADNDDQEFHWVRHIQDDKVVEDCSFTFKKRVVVKPE